MTRLKRLYLSFNPISDISALAGLTLLTELQLQYAEVVDVSALQGLTNLQLIVLNSNQIVDIAPLAANTGLGNGDVVYLVGNPLSSESIDTHIPALAARGVTVYR
jgi:Leucine-rich repeat (LRR) protein